MDFKVKRLPFKHHLLAAVVGAISTQALAVEVDVGQGKAIIGGETFNESLIFTGTLTEPTNVTASQGLSNWGGASVFDSRIQGSLINRADIFLDDQKHLVRAFSVDPWWQLGHSGFSTITGDVIQAGTILISNSNVEGFEVGGATIGASVINSGTIRSTTPTAGLSREMGGIFLHETTVAGDVSNTGEIDLDGEGAVGISLDGNPMQPISIGGKLLNSGTLSVTGKDTSALNVETATSPLRIENSGLISANGSEARAFTLYDGTIDYILNTGTIEAKGETSKVFELAGTTFAPNSAPGSRGIINRGIISADDTVFFVDPDEQTSAFEINQQAGEIRSHSGIAIDAANLATLNWTGGSIIGDILNLNAVNVAGQADFNGSRIIAPVSINAGSLNLAGPGTTLTGNLFVANGAGLDMRLDNNVVPSTPYLSVNGTAQFAQGSTLSLSANPGDFTALPSGVEYTLVRASTVDNDGLSVSSRSSLLDVFSYSSDAQTVKAVVGLKSNQQVQEELTDAGASGSVVTVVNEAKNHVLGQLSQDDPVFQALANASTSQQLAQMGEQLKPDVNRGALDVALSGQTVINGAILNRLSGQRDSREALGVWMQGLSSTLDQDGRGASNGYSANSSGMTVGFDGHLNDNTKVGVAYSYLNSNIHSDLGNKTQVQGNTVSLYGNWALQNWFVDGSLSYGHNDNDSKRHIVGTTAKGSYGSDVLSASVLGGYTFTLSDEATLEPRVAARYSNVHMDGYNEKGSSAALRTGSQRYEVGELGAGLRLAANLPLSTGSLQPEATLMAYHDLMGDRVAQTSRFVLGGSAFSTTGASVARNSYEASLGLNYKVSALTLGAAYTRQARSGFDADGVMIKARYDF